MNQQESWGHYLPRSTVLRDSGLCCRGVGEQQGPKPSMRIRRLSTYALVFLTEGQGTFTGAPHVNGLDVRSPSVMWLFPGVQHTYGPTRGGWREHWVLFEGTAVRGYESLKAWRHARPALQAMPDLRAEIEPVFAAFRRGVATPGRRGEVLAATLTHALIGIASEQTERRAEQDRSSEQESIVDAVVGSALSPVSVADRAGEIGIAPQVLRREIREQTSLSVHELVIQTRLARAQSLLVTTDMSVASVARQVGYDDAAYFSRIFSARVGHAPTIFRQQFHLDSADDSAQAGGARREPQG